MDYKILPHTFKQAKLLGVEVKPSTKKGKKIDVYKDNKLVASVGASSFSDYPHYIQSHGKEYADERRRLYKLRHEKDRKIVGSNGYYASNLLW
jgi:hypothetical protein